MSRLRPKKRCSVFGTIFFPDPLVGSGNPPHRHEARTTTHPTRLCHRMVALAARPPGRSTPRSSQAKNATVMLVGRFQSSNHKRPFETAAFFGLNSKLQ